MVDSEKDYYIKLKPFEQTQDSPDITITAISNLLIKCWGAHHSTFRKTDREFELCEVAGLQGYILDALRNFYPNESDAQDESDYLPASMSTLSRNATLANELLAKGSSLHIGVLANLVTDYYNTVAERIEYRVKINS
ncbi:TPA: hypothetical protein DIV55_00400 [Patescibacteria group bacterium]|uniref:Uncharacterized protein n=1 Tax=Candidatus Gottesmanbacteria bacterium GW2011_GWA1_43_11 TaxID=1618436 RepID=A0A0G1CFE0_9BACT|nr:MAG: hypothetical protein UV59_C0025G0010 [Candidatus Gottesmanbacteria bacterium GW2011_GWA1_43_11]HCS78186.1 hypothetical protein [Patescibacteria group bacterium]